MSFEEKLAIAWNHKNAGQWPESEILCREALSLSPDNAEALHLLGLIAVHFGKKNDAIALIKRAIDLKSPASADMHFDLANIFRLSSLYKEALSYYDLSIQINPSHVNAHAHRATALLHMGRFQEARQSILEAIRIDPYLAGLYSNLGNILSHLGQHKEAIASYEKATSLIHKPAQGLSYSIHNNWGITLVALKKYEEAAEHYTKAIKINPEGSEAYYNYGNLLMDQGFYKKSVEHHEQALRLNPLYAEAKWACAIAQIPSFIETPDETDRSRRAFDRELDKLDLWFDTKTINLGHIAVGSNQPFYLAYQEKNNRELLVKYGRICTRLMRHWGEQHPGIKHPPKATLRIQLGIVSSHIHEHSVWHALIKGWLKKIDRAKFDIHVFKIGDFTDKETTWAKENSSSFEYLTTNISTSAQSIQHKNLDVIIYPEIGMNSLALKLASLRLSPIQMVSWGHPETSGLSTLDYFVSAEAFEPKSADQNYSEKLVLLPHIGCSYQPHTIPDQEINIEPLGIRNDIPILISPGTPYKYAPENDHIFVDLARKIGKCQIVFFKHRMLSDKLQIRIKKCFDKANLKFEDFCLFIPWQDRQAFYSILRQATTFIDTVGFSGFNTAIQAIECALPVVTLEGKFMRGRLATGILRRLELDELVATNNEQYINKVVKLATNPQYNQKIRQLIKKRRHLLFDDQAPIEALEQFLLNIVKSSAI